MKREEPCSTYRSAGTHHTQRGLNVQVKLQRVVLENESCRYHISHAEETHKRRLRWRFGCVDNLGTQSRRQKQSDKHESSSRLAGWRVHLTCVVHCDVSFHNQKHSKIAQTKFTSDTRYWPNMSPCPLNTGSQSTHTP